MKLMNKLFAALVLFGMSNAAFGYDFTVTNKTDKAITVAVSLKSIGNGKQTAVIQPREMNKFSFTGSDVATCLKSISIVQDSGAMRNLPLPTAGESLCKDAAFTVMNFQGDIILVEDFAVNVGKGAQ